jgi:cell fate (sporulation/competence/biofilm development) regulator YmcA (YheA/YmcA/DUF963 family)
MMKNFIMGTIEGDRLVNGYLLSREEVVACMGTEIFQVKNMGDLSEEVEEEVVVSEDMNFDQIQNMMSNMGNVNSSTFTTPLSNLDHRPFWTIQIMKLVDDKHREVERSIAGELSDRQIARYKTKYKKALEGEDTYFTQEATLKGVQAETIKERVLVKGEAWSQAEENAIAIVEAVRVKALDLVEEESNSSQDCLNLMRYLIETKDWSTITSLDTVPERVEDDNED